MCGGTLRANAYLICRLSRETKQYPIRKWADRRKHNKQSWCSTKAFGQQRWRISLSICGNSRNFYTMCPVKHIYSQISRDFARFPVFTVRTLGWKSVAVFVTSRHTSHYRSKTVKSRIFLSSCLWSLTFWSSYKIKKIFLCVPSISWLNTKAGPNTIFELRSFGSNQHRIFEASEEGAEHILVSNKGRNLCATVGLFAFLLCRELFIQSTSRVAGLLLRTQGSAVLHFAAIWTCDTFRMNQLLINYRTVRARSGAPHAGRAYMLRERTLY